MQMAKTAAGVARKAKSRHVDVVVKGTGATGDTKEAKLKDLEKKIKSPDVAKKVARNVKELKPAEKRNFAIWLTLLAVDVATGDGAGALISALGVGLTASEVSGRRARKKAAAKHGSRA